MSAHEDTALELARQRDEHRHEIDRWRAAFKDVCAKLRDAEAQIVALDARNAVLRDQRDAMEVERDAARIDAELRRQSDAPMGVGS